MSGQDTNQLEARITSQLECPVCFNIPRDLPIPCCPSGHIVCRPCKTRVSDCPTCRQPMPANMTNSVVGGLIEQVQHRCKFHDQGCEVRMMLNELMTHEKKCPERTIKCPEILCGSFVKLKDFNDHAMHTPAPATGPHSIIKSLTSTFPWFPFFITKNGQIGQFRVMFAMKDNGEIFHVRLAFHEPQKCVALSIWSSYAEAGTLRANLSIKGDDKEMSMNGLLITSVENVPSIDKCLDENGTYFWAIPVTLAKNFSVKYEHRELNAQYCLLRVGVKIVKK